MYKALLLLVFSQGWLAIGVHAAGRNPLLAQASQLQQQGKLDEAIDTFKKAAAAEPRSAEPHYWLAQALLRGGRHAEGEAHFRTSVKIAPNHAPSHYSLGLLLQRNRRLPEATSTYETVVKVQPTHADAFTNLGICLKNQGRMPDALARYEQAAKLAPQDADIYTNMGVAQQAIGQFERAVESYKMATKIQPKNFNAYFNLGIELKRLSRLGEAVEAYARYRTLRLMLLALSPWISTGYISYSSCASRPFQSLLLVSLFRVYSFLLHSPSALLSSALDISPNYPNALHNVGTLIHPFSQRSHPKLPDGVAALWAAKNSFIGYVNSRRGGDQCPLKLVFDWQNVAENQAATAAAGAAGAAGAVGTKHVQRLRTLVVLADGEGAEYGSSRPHRSMRHAVESAKREAAEAAKAAEAREEGNPGGANAVGLERGGRGGRGGRGVLVADGFPLAAERDLVGEAAKKRLGTVKVIAGGIIGGHGYMAPEVGGADADRGVGTAAAAAAEGGASGEGGGRLAEYHRNGYNNMNYRDQRILLAQFTGGVAIEGEAGMLHDGVTLARLASGGKGESETLPDTPNGLNSACTIYARTQVQRPP
jgi:Flp pilus assembly protein TadD